MNWNWSNLSIVEGDRVVTGSDARRRLQALLPDGITVSDLPELRIAIAGGAIQTGVQARAAVNKAIAPAARLQRRRLETAFPGLPEARKLDGLLAVATWDPDPALEQLATALARAPELRDVFQTRLKRLYDPWPLPTADIVLRDAIGDMVRDAALLRQMDEARGSADTPTIAAFEALVHGVNGAKLATRQRADAIDLGQLLALIPADALRHASRVRQFVEYGCDVGRQYSWRVEDRFHKEGFNTVKIPRGEYDRAAPQTYADHIVPCDKDLANRLYSAIFPRLDCLRPHSVIKEQLAQQGLPARIRIGDDEMRVYGRVIVDPRSRSGTGRVVELVVDVVRHATLEVRFHNAEAGIASDNSLLARMQNYAGAGWVARIYWGPDRSSLGKTLDCYGQVHGKVTGTENAVSGPMNDIHIPIADNAPVHRPHMIRP
ncbi:MAG: hypothetical protein AAGI50_08735 [Pseudomonadota bacterium]